MDFQELGRASRKYTEYWYSRPKSDAPVSPGVVQSSSKAEIFLISGRSVSSFPQEWHLEVKNIALETCQSYFHRVMVEKDVLKGHLASYPHSKRGRKTLLDPLEATDTRCFNPSSSRTRTLCPKTRMIPNSRDILILHQPFWLLSNYSNSPLSSCLIIQLVQWFSFQSWMNIRIT